MAIKCFVGGRFQPPHPGHFNMYLECKRKVDNVIITSSNKIADDSPFTFEEKKFIWKRMFDVDIEYSSNPTFVPKELLEDGDILVVATSEKDAKRYHHTKFFQEYSPEKEMHDWSIGGYYMIMPTMSDNISATFIRENIKYNDNLFSSIYGKFDQEVFDLFNLRI